MYDRYLIVEDSLRASSEGFEFDVRVAYYRSVALSMIDAIEVTVDGEEVSREAIGFVLRGVSYRVNDLEDNSDIRWEFGEIATVRVDRAQPLPPGAHVVEFVQLLRIIYMPGGILRGRDVKSLEIAAG